MNKFGYIDDDTTGCVTHVWTLACTHLECRLFCHTFLLNTICLQCYASFVIVEDATDAQHLTVFSFGDVIQQ